jgi:valyl-tRNA synthetase
MPFVTEEIWEHLSISDKPLSTQEWPKREEKLIDKKTDEKMQTFIDVVAAVRNLKAEWNIKTAQEIDCSFSSKNKEQLEILRANEGTLRLLLKIRGLSLEENPAKTKNSATGIVSDIKICLPLGDIIDVKKEKQRIKNEITSLEKLTKGLHSRLKNKDFLKKAPADVVEKDKLRLGEMEAKIKGLKEAVSNLE